MQSKITKLHILTINCVWPTALCATNSQKSQKGFWTNQMIRTKLKGLALEILEEKIMKDETW